MADTNNKEETIRGFFVKVKKLILELNEDVAFSEQMDLSDSTWEIAFYIVKESIGILKDLSAKDKNLKDKTKKNISHGFFKNIFQKLVESCHTKEDINSVNLRKLIEDTIGKGYYEKALDIFNRLIQKLQNANKPFYSYDIDKFEHPSANVVSTNIDDRHNSLILMFGKSNQANIETLKGMTELTEIHKKILKTYEWFWFGSQLRAPEISSYSKSEGMFWVRIDFSSTGNLKNITNYLDITDLLKQLLDKKFLLTSITCGGPFDYALLSSKGFHRA